MRRQTLQKPSILALAPAFTLAALMWVAACAQPAMVAKPAPMPSPVPEEKAEPQRPVLRAQTFSSLSGWQQDRHAQALVAFQKSCARIKPQPASRFLGGSADIIGGRVGDWLAVCEHASAMQTNNDTAARQFFETWFTPYLVSADNEHTATGSEGLFTGYFEPELDGSMRAGGPYQTPLYSRPPDLISVSLGQFDKDLSGNTVWGRIKGGRLVPYADRAAIEQGQASVQMKPLVWVDDPVEAFFLHVQGSGRVRLAGSDRVVRLGFAGKNGKPYKSIGRLLIDRGEIPADRLTMDSIAQWVRDHPARGRQLLKENPSFVFFRTLDGDGPIGAQGAALTPGRSLAVDRRFLGLGLPLWVETRDPLDKNRPFHRLMVAQDTGGAIKGTVRGDIFFGAGVDARKQAGNMKRAGRYFVLLPVSQVAR